MAMAHGLTIDGHKIPPEELAERKTRSLKPPDKSFTCPECSREKHKRVAFPSALKLGKHRRDVHGVVGSSSSATYYRKQKEKKEFQQNGNVSHAPAIEIIQTPNAKDGHDLAHATQVAEALAVANTAGECKGVIKAASEKYDLASRLFTLRVAQYLITEAKR